MIDIAKSMFMNKQLISLSFIIFIFQWIRLSNSASAPVLWSSNPQFKTGTYQFSIPASGSVDSIVTVTYPAAMVNNSLRFVCVGINSLNFQVSNNTLNLSISVSDFNTTYFSFRVIYNNAPDLTNLKISYLAVDKQFSSPFSISNFFAAPSTTTSVVYYINFTASTAVTLNLSHSNVILAFLQYFWLESYDGRFNVNLDFNLQNQSYYKVNISTLANMKIKQFRFSRIIYDRTSIQELGSSFFQFGYVTAFNGNSSSLYLQLKPLLQSNFHYSMNSFNFTGSNSIGFTTTYSSNIVSTSILTGFDWYRFGYWSYRLKNCPTGYPYFIFSQQLCYDSCGAHYYGNTTSKLCLSCAYDCYTCINNADCVSCSADVDHRQLSGVRCVPMNGYYESGITIAQQCGTQCGTCSVNATNCLTCNSMAYQSGVGICTLCSSILPNCKKCQNSSVCQQCMSPSILNSTTFQCYQPCKDSNCQSCPTNSAICVKCVTKYYADNGNCILCSNAIEQCFKCNLQFPICAYQFSSSSSVNVGLIIGLTLGCLLFCCLIITVIIYRCLQQKKQNKIQIKQESQKETNNNQLGYSLQNIKVQSNENIHQRIESNKNNLGPLDSKQPRIGLNRHQRQINIDDIMV